MTSSADQTPAGYNIIMAAYTIYVPISNARCCLQYIYRYNMYVLCTYYVYIDVAFLMIVICSIKKFYRNFCF